MNKENWILWDDKSYSPYENMAIDELLLTNICEYRKPILRIYDWNCSAMSIGYVQNYNLTIQEALENGNISEDTCVVRRPTGGGVVYHDNDLTYTVIIPKGYYIEEENRMESYNIIHKAILKALELCHINANLAPNESENVDRATMKCFTTPTKYDVLCESRKFSGSAQRRTKNGILHQGSISLEATKGNSKLLKEKLIKAFQECFNIEWENFSVSKTFIDEIKELTTSKYKTDEWNKRK